MDHSTTVKLFIEDDPTEWISGALVCLYDRDRISRDDHLGTNVTNTYGEATFRFTTDEFLDIDDRLGGALPELYVDVFDSRGDRVLSTRSTARRNEVPDLIRIPIERAIAVRHGLI